MHSKQKVSRQHTKQELKANFAGEYIADPQSLSDGCKVTIFEIGSDNWWDHGEIAEMMANTKLVFCYSRFYHFSEVEVYLDTRYN